MRRIIVMSRNPCQDRGDFAEEADTYADGWGRLPELAKRSQVSSEGATDQALVVRLAVQITEPDRVLRHQHSSALAGWCG